MSNVGFSVDGHLAKVHLKRPEALNAITPEMDEALAAAWQRINDDPEIWVALLSAEGDRAFCAGADITSAVSGERAHAFGGGLTGIGGPLVELKKPLVAAVQGHAVGGGFELALCADMLVVSETAQFKLPEVQAGLIDYSGVLHRAMRKLPVNLAMELILTGRPLLADEALRVGLASRKVGRGELEPAALELCSRLLSASPLALIAAKQAAYEGLELPLPEALARTYSGITCFRQSRDAVEAMLALGERRPPSWSGD